MILQKNNIYILFPLEFLTTKRFATIYGEHGGTLFIPNGRIKFQSGLDKKIKFTCIWKCCVKNRR